MLPTYIIAQTNETKRFNFIEAEVALFSFLKVKFIRAVRGNLLAAKTLARYYDQQEALQRLGRELSKAEIGCALAHRRAWARMLRDGHRFALILEDDALISGLLFRIYPSLISFMELAEKPSILLLTPCDYYAQRIVQKTGESRICQFYNGYFTAGYLINCKAVEVILEHFPRVVYPADFWNILKKIVNIYSLVPYVVSISLSENISSTITMRAKNLKSKKDNFKIDINRIFKFLKWKTKGLKAQRLIF